MHIRPETKEDIPAIVDLHNAAFPYDPIVAQNLHDMHIFREPKCLHAAWVAEIDGQIVGNCAYDQHIQQYHPRRFQVHVKVHPDYRHQGIGTTLYDYLLTALEPMNPANLRTDVNGREPEAVRFLEKRGYGVYFREIRSRIDVQNFDASHYAALQAKLRNEGIIIKTLRELLAETDDETRIYREIYDLDWELTRDEPGSEDDTRSTFESHVDICKSDYCLADGWFFAMQDGVMIGTSSLWANLANPTELHVGFTGVKRAYRGRGIATAMKVHTLQFSKARGVAFIDTGNEESNVPMLTVNRKLGFVREPDHMRFEKVLEPITVDAVMN